MKIITRFAPSPTGFLHVGNVRTALINWLFTKKTNGTFILRMDDTDKLRSKPEYAAQIKEDLMWLGIDYDVSFSQSSRENHYAKTTDLLIEMGRLYPCFETQEELEIKRKFLLQAGKPPIYDRSSLKLSSEQIEQKKASGLRPHYRFKLNSGKINWHDLIRGEIEFQAENLSDPILIREDGSLTYMLSSVVDDIDYNITHIARGEDHITNTAISLQIIEALGGKVPNLAHLSLLKTKDSEISKRDGGFDIKSLKTDNIEPLTILSMLARMGSKNNIDIARNTCELINEFDFTNYSKSPVIYDIQELYRLNQKLLATYSYADILPQITSLGMKISEELWDIIKSSLHSLNELQEWQNICYKEIIPIIKEADQEFLNLAKEYLPPDLTVKGAYMNWLEIIKTKTDRKGKSLFMPLRLAITAKEHGPELDRLLAIIPRQQIILRLSGLKG